MRRKRKPTVVSIHRYQELEARYKNLQESHIEFDKLKALSEEACNLRDKAREESLEMLKNFTREVNKLKAEILAAKEYIKCLLA